MTRSWFFARMNTIIAYKKRVHDSINAMKKLFAGKNILLGLTPKKR